MSEIKVGDRVRIAEDVSLRRYKNSCGWNQQMVSQLGTEGTVLEVISEMGWASVDPKEYGRTWNWYLDDLTVIPKGHPHAALMMEYAKDAQTNARPWELWETRFNSYSSKWASVDGCPLWDPEYEYRRKPAKKMVLVNGLKVPAPETEAPGVGVEYWLVDPTCWCKASGPLHWEDTKEDQFWLSSGTVYLNKEDAVARAEAMLITKEVDTAD